MIRTPETDRLARAYGEASTAFRVHNAQTRPTDAQEAGYWTERTISCSTRRLPPEWPWSALWRLRRATAPAIVPSMWS